MRSDRPSRTLSRLAAGGFAVTDIAVESLPVVSLPAGSVLSGTIGTIAGYGVFAAAFFAVADRIYRDVLPADIRGTGFDLLFTVVAVSIMLTQRFVARQTELSAVLIIGPVVVGAVLFAVYVHRVGSRSLTDPTAPLVEPYQQIMIWTDVRSEVVQDLDRDGWRRYGNIVGFSAATGLLLAVPAYIAGVIGLLLARAYPLPDLLAIAWVGGMVVPRRRVDQFTARIPNLRTRVELDTELLATSGEAVRGPFGLIALMFAVAGAFARVSFSLVSPSEWCGQTRSPHLAGYSQRSGSSHLCCGISSELLGQQLGQAVCCCGLGFESSVEFRRIWIGVNQHRTCQQSPFAG